jgi:hypothetical protein
LTATFYPSRSRAKRSREDRRGTIASFSGRLCIPKTLCVRPAQKRANVEGRAGKFHPCKIRDSGRPNNSSKINGLPLHSGAGFWSIEWKIGALSKSQSPSSYWLTRTKTPVTCTLAPSAHWLFFQPSLKWHNGLGAARGQRSRKGPCASYPTRFSFLSAVGPSGRPSYLSASSLHPTVRQFRQLPPQ